MGRYSAAAAVAVICASLAVQTASAAPEADIVAALPGWQDALPSPWYSGYVDISETMGVGMKSHYIFIESEGDPATDPVILWSNGGPGASSLYGLMTELGPLQLNDQSYDAAYDATGVPSLFYNQQTWTRIGNVLIFDWPAPVGFSYCKDDPSGDGNSCGAWDDTRMQNASYASLRGWFDDLFPEYKSNPLYLTGESYAGVYIPKLAQAVLAGNEGNADPLNMKGFAVGDACTGLDVLCGPGSGGPWYSVVFFYGHGQFSNTLYDAIIGECGVDALKTGDGLSDTCNELLAQMWTEVGGYYDYNLYDDCIYEDDIRRRRRKLAAAPAAKAKGGAAPAPFLPLAHLSSSPAPLGAAVNDYQCGGGPAQEVWAAQPAVLAALNVPADAVFFSGDNGDGMTYTLTEHNLMPFYVDVAKNHPELRTLVYNGDTDPGINSFVSQNWTVALGLDEAESWRPWTLDGCQRVGGYVTRYEGAFDFLTIRGSGHMVPTFKPEAAKAFMGSWIADEAYLTYNSTCVPAAASAHNSVDARPPSKESKKAHLERIRNEIKKLEAEAARLLLEV